jgi:prevent-host-death family protein
MRYITVKELRLRTRRLLQEAQAGEEIAVTYRGKPVALIVPFEEDAGLRPRSFEAAWPEIEATLAKTSPEYGTPEEAMKAARRRS